MKRIAKFSKVSFEQYYNDYLDTYGNAKIPKDQIEKIYNNITIDFENTLKTAIGAVAVYRLAVDPLPVILMDEELMMRSGDFVTEPYSEAFVEKYIGNDNIDLYKQTEIYRGYRDYLMAQEKKSEAIFDIIHWQIIDRSKSGDILVQRHLLQFHDRLAVAIVMLSTKIAQVYIDGCFHYSSDVKPLHTDLVIGKSYYNDFFALDSNFNIPFKGGAYLSRITICGEYSYIESNELLDDFEIMGLEHIAQLFENEWIKQEKKFNEWLEGQAGSGE